MVALDHLLRHACRLIVRGPSTDEDGEPVESEPVLVVETRCELQQASSLESHEGAVLTTSWRAWLPVDAPVSGWDALELVETGERLELIGDPWLVVNPRTGESHHVEADLRRSR